MNKFTTSMLAAAVGLALSTGAVAMSQDEHKQAQERIEAQYKADKAKCDAMTGNAKDVCQKEAKGKENIAKAELDAQKDPSARNQRKVAQARADAKYDVAKERCDDLKGKDKDACQLSAKAAHEKDKASIEKQGASSGSTTPANR